MQIKRPADIQSSAIADREVYLKRRAFIRAAAGTAVVAAAQPLGSGQENRLPGLFRNTATRMFNGYGDHVARLCAGMDLTKSY